MSSVSAVQLAGKASSKSFSRRSRRTFRCYVHWRSYWYFVGTRIWMEDFLCFLAFGIGLIALIFFFSVKKIVAPEVHIVRKELPIFKRGKLWAAYGVIFSTILIYTSFYSFTAATIIEPSNSIFLAPPGLILFDIDTFAGLRIGGRCTDRYPLTVKIASTFVCSVLVTLIALLANIPLVLTFIAFLLGIAGFALNPGIVPRVFIVTT